MPTEPIQVVEPSSDLEAQRAKMSSLITSILNETVLRLTHADTNPLIVCIGIASEGGVYTNGISRIDLDANDSTTELIAEMAEIIKKKVFALKSVTVYPEPPKRTGS